MKEQGGKGILNWVNRMEVLEHNVIQWKSDKSNVYSIKGLTKAWLKYEYKTS